LLPVRIEASLRSASLSRSLSRIFSLEHPHCAALARIEPAQATTAFGPRARLALPVRQDDICGIGYRVYHVETACATNVSLAD